ncbi:MAG: hypothetical protein [Siphoviridae sp. ctpQM7]|nr:MAG: hypothetical protein [Siphoviridae sp. ctpQM7]
MPQRIQTTDVKHILPPRQLIRLFRRLRHSRFNP